ncbi:MAG TPA: hypothetical protein VFO70_05985 [Chitinophagaceae bacterium]|nr:hypothetical protein [Chitinophagaceae bacterium]
MRKSIILLNLSLVLLAHSAHSQVIEVRHFFEDQQPFEMTLSSDFKNIMSKRMQKAWQPATVIMRFADSTVIRGDVQIQTRGKFRLANCYMPPLMLNFKNPANPALHPLKKLKLVCGCATSNDDEQLIIKEYLAYKMFNMLTEKSFRVRLTRIRYEDTRGKVKPYTQFGFLLEDVDVMAERNKCSEVQGGRFLTENTDREQMTLIALFQYMIGNTDWSVPHYHNIKLMRPIGDTVSFPYAVPYDLNHCGLVNAPYAVPQEELQIQSVKERAYRGFPRTLEELEKAASLFQQQKGNIEALINNCAWLSNKYKKEILSYIGDFYESISSKSMIKRNFIEGARLQ